MQADEQVAREAVKDALNEAYGIEVAMTRELRAQIALTPRGSYRGALEAHLTQTRDHAERVDLRLSELGHDRGAIDAIVSTAEALIDQGMTIATIPLDLLRRSGERRVLTNARNTAMSEAMELAVYAALQQIANTAGDARTADLAASIMAEERKMLDRVISEIPLLARRVAASDFGGEDSYDLSKTGAGETARDAGKAVADSVANAGAATRRAAKQARRVPGVARAEGQIKGVAASAGDLAITGYDDLTAEEIATKLSALSQIDLAKVDSYERRHANRATVLSRAAALKGSEPWPGYDDQTIDEIRDVLGSGDAALARQVRGYERPRKGRRGVLEAAKRGLATV